MADIAGAANKITVEQTDFQSPGSEATMQDIGGSINFMLDKQFTKVEFLTSGTFNVPADITECIVECIGGGGGGGSGIVGGNDFGGTGGAGGSQRFGLVAVTPLDAITITIGAGGAGDTGGGAGGGGTSSFGTALSSRGGVIGQQADSPAQVPGLLSTFGGIGGIDNNGTDGQPGNIFAGGTGAAAGGRAGGGGGGAGFYGDGGNGGSLAAGAAAAANSGAGGGGGAAPDKDGGAGGSGRITIWYF